MISFKKNASTYGIEKCHPAELPAEFYQVNNRWSGVVDGQQVIIYAGALRHNPSKGVLIMKTLPADSRRIGGRHCAIPENSGSLEIVEVRANRLRIAMERGGSFWFQFPYTLGKAA